MQVVAEKKCERPIHTQSRIHACYHRYFAICWRSFVRIRRKGCSGREVSMDRVPLRGQLQAAFVERGGIFGVGCLEFVRDGHGYF